MFTIFVRRNFIIFYPRISNIVIHMLESHLQRKTETIGLLKETKICYLEKSKLWQELWQKTIDYLLQSYSPSSLKSHDGVTLPWRGQSSPKHCLGIQALQNSWWEHHVPHSTRPQDSVWPKVLIQEASTRQKKRVSSESCLSCFLLFFSSYSLPHLLWDSELSGNNLKAICSLHCNENETEIMT